MDRFSDQVRHRFERFALGLTSVALFAIGLLRLARSGILNDPAPMSLPLLAVGMAVVIVSVWKLFALRVWREHDLTRLRRGLWILPAGAAVTAALALAGSALDLYTVAALLWMGLRFMYRRKVAAQV